MAIHTLHENVTALGVAVAVSYGTQCQQDLTDSVTTVSSREFVQGQITSPNQLMLAK